jgi:hypothetical protein
VVDIARSWPTRRCLSSAARLILRVRPGTHEAGYARHSALRRARGGRADGGGAALDGRQRGASEGLAGRRQLHAARSRSNSATPFRSSSWRIWALRGGCRHVETLGGAGEVAVVGDGKNQ